MINKWGLETGDLLFKPDEVGVVKEIRETPYGLIFVIYWTWNQEGYTGFTEIPEQLLCKAFFTKFKHIKGTQ
jgi:hypothetical protein